MPRELLPELISDIILRLPAESLLRFRCVSNSLFHEIDSPNFAQNHLKRSIETRSHRKLIFTNSEGLYAADFDHDLKNALKFNYQFTDPEQYHTSIDGSCRGLILLSVYQKNSRTESLFIWNPTSRQLKMLPPEENPSALRGFRYGLGYDSVSDDYKVVRITTDNSFCPGGTHYELPNVSVFSLKSNSWRWTQDIHLNIALASRALGYANGYLYWIYFGDEFSRKVGCFDLANEVFITLTSFRSPQDGGLFDKVGMNSLVTTNAAVVEENVLLQEIYTEPEVYKFYSSMVDELNALPVGIWSETFTFQQHHTPSTPFSGRAMATTPLAYSKDGTYVLLHEHNDMFWYNMEKKTKRQVEGLKEFFESDPPKSCMLFGEVLFH